MKWNKAAVKAVYQAGYVAAGLAVLTLANRSQWWAVMIVGAATAFVNWYKHRGD
jgi:hypothetical protein